MKGNLMRAANHGRVAQIEENSDKATKVTMMRRVFRSTTPIRNLLLLHKQGLRSTPPPSPPSAFHKPVTRSKKRGRSPLRTAKSVANCPRRDHDADSESEEGRGKRAELAWMSYLRGSRCSYQAGTMGCRPFNTSKLGVCEWSRGCLQWQGLYTLTQMIAYS